tara:strand:- start:11271 stop:12029 length:759 start_codon:yes stop_codon:yes gene_type:complete
LDFSDKKILVTGGSRGIGRAIATGFSQKGARLAINYLTNSEGAELTHAKLTGEGHIAIQGDVAKAIEVEQLVKKAIAALGGLDIVVNNAGIGIYHPIPATGYEAWQLAWQQTINANLFGPANICFCAASYMKDHGGGRIINISSRGAFRGEPTKPAYGASKAGLNSLTQSLAVALAPHKIYVGAVAPGFVDTELAADRLNSPEGEAIRAQSPFNRVATPEEVAHAVYFLASEGAEFSTGTIIDVNGASYLRT